MSNKDYYKILDVDKNSDDETIKKAYKKLALQYHPDKNQGNEEASEKFKIIAEAYGVLGNKDKRNQYDNFGNVDDILNGNEDPFSVFNEIFKSHINNFMNMKYENDIDLGNIFSNMSGMPEKSFPFGNVHVRVHTFTNDIYNDNRRIDEEQYTEDDEPVKNSFGNIFSNLFKNKNKKHNIEEKVKTITKTKIIYNKPESIIYNINVSFSDIYNMKKKKIIIKRIRKKNGDYLEKKKKIEIPIYGREIILECEGHEVKDYKEKGDIIINIFNKNNDNFKRINEYDILTHKDIIISDLYNKSSLEYDLILPNGEILKVKSDNLLLNKYLIQKIINKGLPYEEDNILKYGNLYIYYIIKFPDSIEDLKNINNDNNNNNDNNDNDNDNDNNKYLFAENTVINELFQNS
jgi:DnaJ-class molecular chaperone